MKIKVALAYHVKVNPEQLAALQKHDPSAAIHPDTHSVEWYRGQLVEPLVVDPCELYRDPALKGIEFRIEGGSQDLSTFVSVLDDIRTAIGRISGAYTPTQQLNERCSVHVPNLGLLQIASVELLQDCCTDDLQSHLERGWRILAVCVQPNQRRPDYIIGLPRKEEL